MADLALEAQALRKDFGAKTAVRDLTLSVPRGEVFGFLGPNGAGKTTSIKMLLGLVHPTSGSGRLLGEAIGQTRARTRVGYLPEHFAFHEWLQGRELLRFHGRLLGLRGPALEQSLGENRKNMRKATIAELEHALDGNPRRAEIVEGFDALGEHMTPEPMNTEPMEASTGGGVA